MAKLDDRRKLGAEILKKYLRSAGNDKYAAAADLIADILLSVAENPDEASSVLRAAEVDYRRSVETEDFGAEG